MYKMYILRFILLDRDQYKSFIYTFNYNYKKYL